jgi:Flp pilus assembly protein TadD
MPPQKTKSESTPRNTAKSAGPRSADWREGPPVWVVAIVLALAIGLVYGRGLRSPFIFDDAVAIVTNGSITSVWPLIGPAEHRGPLNPPPDLPTSGRPLVNLSLALNYWAGGLDSFGYHVVNVVIHFLSAMLAWAIVRRTLLLPYFAGRFEASAGWLAIAVAMVWALHPLQTEAVIYVTQRTELMVALFFLATLYCSLRYWTVSALHLGAGQGEGASEFGRINRQRLMWLALAVVSCLAGMASKEVMVSAPLIVLLFERTFLAGSLKSALRRSWPLYAGLASTWLLLTVLSLGAPHGKSAGFHLGIGAYEWWLTQQKILLMYFKLAFWPSPLLLHYQLPYLQRLAQAWMYVVPVLLIGFAVFVLLLRNHPLGFLGTWAFAILAPTMGVPVVFEMAAERRMYLPLLALIIPFVVGGYLLLFARLRFAGGGRAVLAAVICVLAVASGLIGANRLAAYQDEAILWREVLQFQPANYLAHNNLGHLLIKSDQIPEGIVELQAAVASNPDYEIAFNNLGVALMRASRDKEAIESLKHALKINPDYADAWQNLGNALKNVGRLPEAIENIGHALRLKPYDAEAHNNMGVALAASGRIPQAIEHFREAVRLNPTDVKTLVNLGKLLDEVGDSDEAYNQFAQALQLQPNRADVHSYLGAILGKAGRTSEAIEHFRLAVQIDPKFADAYSNLAMALALTNRPAEAIATSQRAIEAARANGQPDAARAAEEWLTRYRADLQRSGNQSR